MSTFTVSIPLDARYRALAGEVAAKYAELVGGSTGDAEGLADAVTRAVDALGPDPASEANVDMVFVREGGGVQVQLRSGGKSSVVTHLLTAAQR